ncbi:ankyrin-1-like isoform X2 [Phymastichus coffea]|uniref:ankyrin-1-like isoform X2 n=1 Tax=Phymastichus coffea TaxID=108790 RepID=UPI00273C31C5|nr:ankyrin-1-like isoform X2 [Phymastichus coffea]XP_058809676.1 ankyrin-1-like isoform X2 [Phymastichus coffea]
MFRFRSSKKRLDREVRKLVKQKKNEKIISIIKTYNSSDLIDCKGTTIFHLAAQYSNVDLINILLSCGYDINVRDTQGTTPLLTAIHHNNLEVVKLLLDAKADIFVPNATGQTPLQLLGDKKNELPASVTENLLNRLKNCRGNARDTARTLVDAHCSLELALMLERADVTEAMLQHTEELSGHHTRDLLLAAMNSTYLENVPVLLQHGSKAAFRKGKFLEILAERIKGSAFELESIRPFLLKLPDWDVVDANFIEFLQKVFEKLEKPVLDKLLECKVDDYVRRKFEMELLVHAVVNRNDNVIELLRDENFHVDARDQSGQTGLHIATIHGYPDRVQYLLDRGANPNVLDKRGQSPLILAWDTKCIKLLLRAGADVQIIDHSGLTVFEKSSKLSEPICLLLGHLAIVEDCGVKIKRKIFNQINYHDDFRQCFDKCRMQIERMKMQEIRTALTLYMCLVQKPENLIKHVRHRETVISILDCARKLRLPPFYVSTVEYNLNRTLNMIIR